MHDSNPLGKGRVANDTFIIPVDDDNASKSKDFSVKVTRLMLSRQETPVKGLSREAAKHIFTADQASVSFDISSETSSATESIVFPLKYNVMFISSYACKPPRGLVTHLKYYTEPADGHEHDHDHDHDIDNNNGHLQYPHLPGHPLHKSYKYKYIPLEDLRANTRPSIITFPEDVKTPTKESSLPANQKIDEHASSTGDAKEEKKKEPELEPIWILDARSSNHEKDKEVFARAWCAAVGVHALVGRVGRTCLACCVREARAVGVGVVIRV